MSKALVTLLCTYTLCIGCYVPWMAKCNNRSCTTIGPLAISIGINISTYNYYTVLSEVLSVMISGWHCSYTYLLPGLLQLSYQQWRLKRTIPSKITKIGAKVYLKACSRCITIPVVDSVSQTCLFRIKPPLNCKL